MKIALWSIMAATGLTLAGCSNNDNGPPVSTTSSGNGSSSTAPTSSAPNSSGAPTDFVAFVNQQILVQSQPPFGTAPAATTSLTTDLALGSADAFLIYNFGAGDALPPGTYQASVACAQLGTAACNPAVSADLNSTLN